MALNCLNLSGLRRGIVDIKIGMHLVQERGVSTSGVSMGKRNFRKFDFGNKRGHREFQKNRIKGMYPDIPIRTEVKPAGYVYGKQFYPVPEMIPEFIVPDLTDFELKPYVSYKTAEIYQSEFTAEDLFEVAYKNKIEKDFDVKKLDQEGNPLEPSASESLTSEEAWIQARRTGSDIFSERIPKLWECLEINLDDLDRKKQEQKELAEKAMMEMKITVKT